MLGSHLIISDTITCLRIVEDYMAGEAWRLVRKDKDDVGAGESELLMSTAILIFELEMLEVIVLKVGAGGRPDAMNVVYDECMLVDALASVDPYQRAILAHTVEEIAREKARIASKGKPLVFGRQRYAEVISAVKEVLKVEGNAVDVWLVRRREWDASMDGDGQQTRNLDGSFSFRPSNSTKPRPQTVELVVACFLHPVKALLPLYAWTTILRQTTAEAVVVIVLQTTSAGA